jgi:uncharacterized membrane protein YfcA
MVLYLLVGLAAGVLSGLFGIGGGIVIVPSLVLAAGMTQVRANGTSLGALLLPVGALGAWEYWRHGNLDTRAALWIALGLFCGALAGAWVANRLAVVMTPLQMKRIFSLFLGAVAVRYWFG